MRPDLKLGIEAGNLSGRDGYLLGEAVEAHVSDADRETAGFHVIDEELALGIRNDDNSLWLQLNSCALQNATGIIRDVATDSALTLLRKSRHP